MSDVHLTAEDEPYRECLTSSDSQSLYITHIIRWDPASLSRYRDQVMGSIGSGSVQTGSLGPSQPIQCVPGLFLWEQRRRSVNSDH
jgi:hypothetical protein